MYYRCGTDISSGLFSLDPLPVDPTTPAIKDIDISHIYASGCRASAGFIAGLPEEPIEQLRISSSEFATDENSVVKPEDSNMFWGIPPVAVKSFRLLNVKDPEFNNVSVRGPAESFIYC